MVASPPRIPFLPPENYLIIYFATFCVANRRAVLAEPRVFERFSSACQRLEQWKIFGAVVMPDHVHVILAPLKREASVKNAVAGLKRGTRQREDSWSWQQGCFDRLLRRNETAQAKWDYVRENPVRAGLVEHWTQWPYRLGEF